MVLRCALRLLRCWRPRFRAFRHVKLRPLAAADIEINPPPVRAEHRVRVRHAPRTRAVRVVETVDDDMVRPACVGDDDAPLLRRTAKVFQRRVGDDESAVGTRRRMITAHGGQAGEATILAIVAVEERETRLDNCAPVRMPRRVPPFLAHVEEALLLKAVAYEPLPVARGPAAGVG